MDFATRRPAAAPDAIAPDGAEVRLLCGVAGGDMAQFTLGPGAVARAVAHRTVEEVWFVVSGHGRMWRRQKAREEIVALDPAMSLSIPLGTHFQFRCDGAEPLVIVGCTMPPWPGGDEAYPVSGCWPATL